VKLAGILLAAGSSTRFGADKLLHPLADGTPMALASARALRAALPWVVVVTRSGDAELAGLIGREKLVTATCHDADQGMGVSIVCGVAATRDADGWLVAVADMPFIRGDTIARVAGELTRGAARRPRPPCWIRAPLRPAIACAAGQQRRSRHRRAARVRACAHRMC